MSVGIPFINDVVAPLLHQKYNITINGKVEEIISAQQKVYMIPCCCRGYLLQGKGEKYTPLVTDVPDDIAIHNALKRGAGKLIVRQWISSARFWNFNDVSDIKEVRNIANAEVSGYRIAKHILDYRRNNVIHDKSEMIPEVLYFSGDNYVNDKNSFYWALLSFVGRESNNFGHCRCHDITFTQQMVKVRREFEFDELHPRHGRVDEQRCERYAIKILEQVVLPLHKYFFSCAQQNESHCVTNYWKSLHDLGLQEHEIFFRSGPIFYRDMICAYKDALKRMQKYMNIDCGVDIKDRHITSLLNVIKLCLKHLDQQERSISKIPASLVHCDLQPQNLIFWKESSQIIGENCIPEISSVLDWEEANFADPRFEVLLICRKVCANMNQAHKIWAHYKRRVVDSFRDVIVGAIEPWLQLEGVHSIVALTLQVMNLIGGGRNPWESKKDLKGKIDRELYRLIMLGMTFCSDAISDPSLKDRLH